MPYEVVPGITSGIAGPIYNGIPCTDRRKSSFVLFATGHKAKDKDVASVPWHWIAGAKGTVLTLPAAGAKPATHTLVLQAVTTPKWLGRRGRVYQRERVLWLSAVGRTDARRPDVLYALLESRV